MSVKYSNTPKKYSNMSMKYSNMPIKYSNTSIKYSNMPIKYSNMSIKCRGYKDVKSAKRKCQKSGEAGYRSLYLPHAKRALPFELHPLP
jgi:hypothetical protein